MVFGGDLFRLAIGDTAPLLVLLAAVFFRTQRFRKPRTHSSFLGTGDRGDADVEC